MSSTTNIFRLTSGLNEIWLGFKAATASQTKYDRWFTTFWLLGPFIMLIERTPADVWLSVISIAFVVRSVLQRDAQWLTVWWVRLACLFWACCLFSAALSDLPSYSIGETVAWFRFPLFAMAAAFWLGRDRRIIYAMLVMIGAGMICMCLILLAEIVIVGSQNGRLSWPYGDLVPGNYLAKASLPAFVVIVAFATSANRKIAGLAALVAMFSISLSVMTGERINFLIRACSGMLAAIVWKPKLGRVIMLIAVEVGAVFALLASAPGYLGRFIDNFIANIPIHADSNYYQTMRPGVLAFDLEPIFGVGPGNLRLLCDEMTRGLTNVQCHPHPHNYYIQMLGEAGIVGLITGTLFLGSIIWACAKPALRDRSNVVVASMWIVPFAFFWPIASTADFFGQWNNIFMWSAVAVALAGAQIGDQDQPGAKG